MCDITSYCEAWTWEKGGKKCWFKKREGWSVKGDSRYESGFKNQGPWYDPNTNFSGGDHDCS